ncbi:MAG: GrdX family protein [Clostridiaceae bacterium]|nr:GrdX family protein [Clostridiaceae bacterium]
MDFIIITNNPLVNEKYSMKYCVYYNECSYEDVFKQVRDKIHQGHILLSHPLSGSVKPNETPYKSVMLSAKRGLLDKQSVEIIEDCVLAVAKFERYKKRTYILNDRVKADFQLIDFTLIESAVGSAIVI